MPVFSTDCFCSEAVQLLVREHDESLSNFANYDMTLRLLPKTVLRWFVLYAKLAKIHHKN